MRIEPSRGWVSLQLKSLWEYRELAYFLVWRDVKVRYKQTALGVAWALLQPLLTMLIFTLVFGRLAKIPSDGIPYPIFSFAGLAPWTFFAYGLNQSSASLVGSANLIRKIYFPRLIIPLATVLSGLVDLFLTLVMLLGMMAWYGVPLTIKVLWLPAFLVLGFITALGVGLWLSALNVEYRDVKYMVPFLVQFWMYATPIAYPSSLLKEPWKTLFSLNPLTGVVEGFRWCLLNTPTQPGIMVLISSSAALLVLAGGLYYFRRVERNFADVV
jgi:lipopolysaccharide transport system permease protein